MHILTIFLFSFFFATYKKQKIFNAKIAIKYTNESHIGPGSQTIKDEVVLFSMLTKTANNNEQLVNPLAQLNTINKTFCSNLN